MGIRSLNEKQLEQVFQSFLMDMVNTGRITWETMCENMYESHKEKHRKAMYRYYADTYFVKDDFWA